jgi:hypothetical protein
MPQGDVKRAQIVLLAAGLSTRSIAQEVGVQPFNRALSANGGIALPTTEL